MQNIAFAFPSYYRPIAVVTLLALLAWATGLPSLLSIAQAANVTQFSNTLTDSHPGAVATHTIEFGLVSNISGGETMRITFDPETQAFDLTDLLFTDITITAASGGPINQVLNVGACDGDPGQIYVSDIDTTADYIELTVCTGDTIPSGTDVVLVVGDAEQIVNPSTVGSYVIRLGGTMTNNGDTRVAIIENVTVTATVETTFTFAILGVDEGDTTNITTTGTSTATSIPFGAIPPDTPLYMEQELQVNTNAINGFSVTVFADQTLLSANGATIDPFIDGSEEPTPTLWEKSLPVLSNDDTWGHWGLTTDDQDLLSGLDFGGGTLFVGNFIGNPVEVFHHGTPVLATSGTGIGSTRVGYRVQITALQEAATDYTATLTYIATPVF